MQPRDCLDPALDPLGFIQQLLPPAADASGAVAGQCIPWDSTAVPAPAVAMPGGPTSIATHGGLVAAQPPFPPQNLWDLLPEHMPDTYPHRMHKMPQLQHVAPITGSSTGVAAAAACRESAATALAYWESHRCPSGSSVQHGEGQHWQRAPPTAFQQQQLQQQQRHNQQAAAGRQERYMNGNPPSVLNWHVQHTHRAAIPNRTAGTFTCADAGPVATRNDPLLAAASACSTGPATAAGDEVTALLAAAQGRMAQLTPDWPPELRLATLEAVLLAQQTQAQQHQWDTVSGTAAGGHGLLAARLGCRVPISCAALSHVALHLPDEAHLAAARQLQEELQACWVNGVALPSIGSNELLPKHTQTADGCSSSSSFMGLRDPYYNPCNASNGSNSISTSCTGPVLQTAGPPHVASAGGGDPGGMLHQLPHVTSEALTVALLGAWGSAPKMTCLLSTAGGAALAAAEAGHAEQQRTTKGCASACQQQLPEQLLEWAAAGGTVAAVASSLAQLATHTHLSSTAGGLLAVTPGPGVDFGTNQVLVEQQQTSDTGQQAGQLTQHGPLQQPSTSSATSRSESCTGTIGKGTSRATSRSQSCSTSSSRRVPGQPVVRELVITNIHASQDVLLLNVCLAPEYKEWVSLSDPLGIACHPEHQMQQAKQHMLQQQGQHRTSDGGVGPVPDHVAGAPPAVLLPPGADYTVTIALRTSSARRHSQAELGVISQICVVTAAATTDATAANNTDKHENSLQAHAVVQASTNEAASRSHSQSSMPVLPAGWQALVCGVPVAGGLVGQLADLQSVLRADAKPFISAALRQLFVAPPAPGRPFAFLAVPTDLGWDVPLNKWHQYNGLAYLGDRQQPGLVPAAQVAQCTLKRFKAMCAASSATSKASGQAPLLSGGPPILQQWQRLLLLEEGACERDIASYSVYNVRLAAAVFTPANDGERLRRYAICAWPAPPDADAEMFTYRGPNLSALVGGTRVPRLAVISVPGLPENRPGLVTGDVVYVRLASAINQPAHRAVLEGLPEAIRVATKCYQKKIKQFGRNGLQDTTQSLHEVAALNVLFAQLDHQAASAVDVEAAGLVAAVDGSRCLLIMPDAFWLLLQLLHNYDTPKDPATGRKANPSGSWGTSPAAALPILVHACFCFDRTGHGRMQAVLPYLAASPRLLLPPGLLTGISAASDGRSFSTGSGAEAAAVVMTNELLAVGGVASPQKQEQVLSVASSLQLVGGVPLNHHQRLAVATLLCGGGVVAPYVLFGPPGTGKTVTLVEAVLQYRLQFPSARLLCCAPANYSADLLCSALARAGVTPAEMLRLNDPRRPLVQSKTDTLPFCAINTSLDCFSLEQGLKQAARRPIVICSTITAGLLLPKPRQSAALPIIAPGSHPPAPGSRAWQQQQHQLSPAVQFDLVVVDEAGQGLAPEVLLPLSLAKPGAAAMLAGDPRQLGPVLRSATAAAAGLGVSLLDSWIQFWHSACPQLAAAHEQQQLQQEGTRTGAAAASVGPVAMCYGMLNDNYRSHRRLLDLPSRLFYGGALRAKAAAAAVAPPPWSELMARRDAEEQGAGTSASTTAAPAGDSAEGDGGWAELCPSSMLFVGVNGEQRQDGDAPSYYNPQEVLVLAELLTSLLGAAAAGGNGGAVQAAVSVDDIGIIATYRRQVQKIRLLLRRRGLGAVRVGTVDDYQGQEERIIFISTTLSKPESLPPPLPDVSAIQQQQQHGMFAAAVGGMPNQSGSDLLGGMSDVGLWRNPKRFNVAITRAKALLVVVGSPMVLAADDNWRQLLRHCAARGAYRGAGSSYLQQLLRVDAAPAEGDLMQELNLGNTTAAAAAAQRRRNAAGLSSALDSLLDDDGCGDADTQLALAVQAIAAAAQLGMGSAEQLYPQTLDEYYAACAEEQPWKVAI